MNITRNNDSILLQYTNELKEIYTCIIDDSDICVKNFLDNDLDRMEILLKNHTLYEKNGNYVLRVNGDIPIVIEYVLRRDDAMKLRRQVEKLEEENKKNLKESVSLYFHDSCLEEKNEKIKNLQEKLEEKMSKIKELDILVYEISEREKKEKELGKELSQKVEKREKTICEYENKISAIEKKIKEFEEKEKGYNLLKITSTEEIPSLKTVIAELQEKNKKIPSLKTVIAELQEKNKEKNKGKFFKPP